MAKNSGCCCARLSLPAKICLIVVAVIAAAVIGLGGFALHVYLDVWQDDSILKISDGAINCTVNCVEGLDHSLWDAVLKEVVFENQIRDDIMFNAVDFKRLRTDDKLRKKHLEYLDLLASIDVDSLSKDEALAMMINAYNAFAVDLIVTQNPGGSIRDLTDLLKGSVFKRFSWKLKIEDEVVDINLDSVEHKLIRETITEHSVPEVHGGVNCVSLSCPDLRAEAYTGARVHEQLKEQTGIWLQNEGKGLRLDEENNILYMSALFDWFREDFVSIEHGGSNLNIDAKEPIEWAMQYATDEVREYVEKNNPEIMFIGYNWKLISPN